MNNNLGLVVFVPVAILVFFICWLGIKSNRAMPQYDERQIAARGKSFELGFYTFAICNALIAIMDSLEIQWAESATIEIFLAILIAFGVFAVTAIRKDAYFGLNENIKLSAILLSILAGINLLTGVMSVLSGEETLLENGKVGDRILNLAVSVLLISVLITLLIHKKKQCAAADGESDE